MSLLDKLKSENPFDGSKLKLSESDILESGVCGPCWGKQEYEGKFIEYAKDQQKDILNHDKTAQKAFVQQFIEDQVTGIKLQKDKGKAVCPSCKSDYASRLIKN